MAAYHDEAYVLLYASLKIRLSTALDSAALKCHLPHSKGGKIDPIFVDHN